MMYDVGHADNAGGDDDDDGRCVIHAENVSNQ